MVNVRLRGLIILVAGLAWAHVAAADPITQYVSNGNFANITTPGGAAYEIDGPSGTSTDVTGWTSTGYNFLFTPGTATGAGAYSGQYSNYLKLYGAADGGATGNTWNGNSPEGGNFFGADGAYQTGPITQSISNLTIGTTYLLTFEWAGAQQSGYSGATTEGWNVCLGSTCNGTGMLPDISHGFTGWQNAGFAFTASATTETLSFLALGTPTGEPPFSLLDNVSLVYDVPEPTSAALMILGMLALLATSRRKSA